MLVAAALVALAPPSGLAVADERGAPWKRHTIDDSSRGADGVRLADANGDGLPDVATPWEEGGLVRVAINPGPARSREPWPAVTVGRVGSPEDAVLVDLDGDGAMDVVSASEGRTQRISVHWAPRERERYLEESAWRTEPLPASLGGQRWMFTVPVQVDGRRGVDLVAGSKGAGASIGWFESPDDPRDLAAWRWRRLRDAGWVMSLVATDVDGDGDDDIVASDRKGPRRGCLWLENPGPGRAGDPWTEHRIGAGDREPMFLTVSDLDGDGRDDVLAAIQGDELLLHRRAGGTPLGWESTPIPLPERSGKGKAVATADVDLDGTLDVIFSCEHARDVSGVAWLSRRGDTGWAAREISGVEGIKYDLVAPIDLDGDGDLDVVTCEETAGLGVVWYENPTRTPARRPYVLLTNDDGVESPGLAAILAELETFADVLVAAPSANASASSQALTLREISLRRIALEKSSATAWAVDASPASCVHLAIHELAGDRKFDLAVSGINRGQNVGTNIALSGTVGAAKMARDLGVTAVALSLTYGSKEYAAAAKQAALLLREVLERGGPPVLLNVNFPGGDPSAWRAPMLTRPGPPAFRVVYRRRDDGDGITLVPRLDLTFATAEEGTDAWAIGRKHIAVTPLPAVASDDDGAHRLRSWRFFSESR